jgi:hypothetical protein
MKTHHLLFIGIGGVVAGWVVNNIVQGGSAFQMPASGTWFTSAAASQ